MLSWMRATCFLSLIFLSPASVWAQTADLLVVQNTTALQAVASTFAPAVLRLDAATGVGAPPQIFISTPTACSITGGDVGSQVPSSDGKCWIARYGSNNADVRQWGCIGNASFDNSTCIQAAINAMQRKMLHIGGGLFLVNSSLVSAGQIIIEGDGGGKGIYDSGCLSGLRAGTANFDLLTLQGAGSVLQNLCFDSVSKTSTSGAAIAIPGGANSVRVEGNQINGICWGIDVSGNSGGAGAQNLETVIFANTLTISSNSPSCGGIRVGANSISARTVDLKLQNNVVYCNNQPGTGLLVLDSGGILAQGNVFSYNCGVGTKLFPGAGQVVQWSSFSGSALGDTDQASDLVIDTNSNTATLFGNRFAGAWASNVSGGAAILIQNTANSPNVTGIDMVQQTVYARPNLPGIDIKSGTNIRIKDSTICSSGTSSAAAIVYEGNASDVSIQNNRIGQCDNYAGGTLATGIRIATSSQNIGIVTGNNFIYTTTPIDWAPTNNSNAIKFIAADNLGVDDAFAAPVPTAALVTLPLNGIAILTGSGTVSSINPMFQGRRVKMIVQGTVNFTTGGNVCNVLATTFNQTVDGVFNSTYGCWFLR
ncbi:hypothetical protein HB780_02245 (plasmid) [Rhizobium lusitanum]|uniref:hypothetical protein n=1 Tax=Rhizobium lusitanum TaxID=293958 RepID=UPI0016209A2A|nr:hypothetical protein [Rhizobium lusitanum]QND44629.1 hypothetical protein HB780_02245 [Rhizobium lusitanum]